MKCPKVAKNLGVCDVRKYFLIKFFFLKIIEFCDYFDANVKKLLLNSLDKAPFKAAAKVEAKQKMLQSREYNICIAVRMNLDLTEKTPAKKHNQ